MLLDSFIVIIIIINTIIIIITTLIIVVVAAAVGAIGGLKNCSGHCLFDWVFWGFFLITYANILVVCSH